MNNFLRGAWAAAIIKFCEGVGRCSDLINRLGFSPGLKRLFEEAALGAIQRLQRLPSGELQKYRERKLREIICFAEENTTYWKNAIGGNGICAEPADSISGKLKDFPILERSVIIRDFGGVTVSGIGAYKKTTSGSTGSPLVFSVDEASYTRRALAAGLALKIAGKSGVRVLRLSYQDMPWSKHQGEYFNPADIEGGLIVSIKANKPRILYGTVSHVSLVADYFLKEKYFYQFDAVLTRSEHLTPELRDRLAGVFRSEVYNIYASREFGPIGQECAERGGFHINEDILFLEVVDESGMVVPTGETGDILITSFLNKSLPFIRYRIGDRGAFVGGKCRCGLETERIKVAGRTADFILFPGGDRMSLLDLYPAASVAGVRSFQFEQNTTDELIVRVVPESAGDLSLDEKVRQKIYQIIGRRPEEFSVAVGIVSDIPLAPNGKRRILISGVGRARIKK